MSTTEKQIATTILQQIMAADHWALGAWGCQQKIALNEGDQGERIGYILGGVMFKIRTPKIKQGGKVIVYLKPNDTYTVRVVKIRGVKCTEVETVEGVYCDMLTSVIDGIIENKRG